MWTTLNFRSKGKNQKNGSRHLQEDPRYRIWTTSVDWFRLHNRRQRDRQTYTHTFVVKHIFRLWEWFHEITGIYPISKLSLFIYYLFISKTYGRLARWRKWRACDVGEAEEGSENDLWRGWSNGRVGEWAVT